MAQTRARARTAQRRTSELSGTRAEGVESSLGRDEYLLLVAVEEARGLTVGVSNGVDSSFSDRRREADMVGWLNGQRSQRRRRPEVRERKRGQSCSDPGSYTTEMREEQRFRINFPIIT